jgi:hypothetical protein
MNGKKILYIYTMENYSAIKKNKIMSLAGKSIELEIIMLSEISQPEKDKISHVHVASRPEKKK